MDFYTKLARRLNLFLSVTGMHLHTFQELPPRLRASLSIKVRVSAGTHDFQALKDDHRQGGLWQEFAAIRASFYGDSGFQEMAERGLPVAVRLIERARRNHLLKRDQKQLNQLRCSVRVKIEHTISRRKKYRIASEPYRNRDEDYDQTMNIVGGLVNLRAYERIFQRTGVRL